MSTEATRWPAVELGAAPAPETAIRARRPSAATAANTLLGIRTIWLGVSLAIVTMLAPKRNNFDLVTVILRKLGARGVSGSPLGRRVEPRIDFLEAVAGAQEIHRRWVARRNRDGEAGLAKAVLQDEDAPAQEIGIVRQQNLLIP